MAYEKQPYTGGDRKPFVPYTTEQKKEFAKQFTPNEIKSYHRGRRNAYSHMANIGNRESLFIQSNMAKDGAAAQGGATPLENWRAASPKPAALQASAPTAARPHGKPENIAPMAARTYSKQETAAPIPAKPSKKPENAAPRSHDLSKIPPGTPLDKALKAYMGQRKNQS
jgi:hypothetical protein